MVFEGFESDLIRVGEASATFAATFPSSATITWPRNHRTN